MRVSEFRAVHHLFIADSPALERIDSNLIHGRAGLVEAAAIFSAILAAWFTAAAFPLS